MRFILLEALVEGYIDLKRLYSPVYTVYTLSSLYNDYAYFYSISNGTEMGEYNQYISLTTINNTKTNISLEMTPVKEIGRNVLSSSINAKSGSTVPNKNNFTVPYVSQYISRSAPDALWPFFFTCMGSL